MTPDGEAPPAAAGWRRRLPPFNPRQRRVFWIVTTAGFFDNYDRALLSLALKQIQRSLSISEVGLGRMLSLIRFGYVFSLLVTPLADRFGRRRLLLYTIVAYTVATALSALAPGARSFVAFQVIARAFAAAEAAVALVIVAEEMDAAVRGWTIGLLGALTLCGFGMAAMVFAMIGIVPFGWRGLYALAVIPLAIIIPLRRALPETQRFSSLNVQVEGWNWLKPMAELIRRVPSRLAMVTGVSFLYGVGSTAVFLFTPKYLQEAHRWAPAQVSSLYIFGGAIGILGNVVAGRVSDRIGRRSMGATFFVLAGVLQIIFFNSSGAVLVVAWTLALFADSASATILNAYSTELFPTSMRSSAAIAVSTAFMIGGGLGLYAEAVLVGFGLSHWRAISRLAIFWLLAPLIMMVSFPETAGRELEAISAEPA